MSDLQGPESTAVDENAAAAEASSAPVLRVVNPDATPEEIAALVAIFSALGGSQSTPRLPRPEWSAPERMARHTAHTSLTHGLGGWRSSGLPR